MKRFELRAGPALFWFGCFALLAAARLCHSGVLWADEAYGMAGARRILEGAALYREVWFDKPPLYAWVYLLWGAQAGWVLRIAGALFALLCCWLAARTAKELFGPREAYVAAAAMAFFLSFDHPVAILSLAPDFLLIPFALGSVWAVAVGRPGLAGAVAAAGLLAHTKAAILLPLLLLWNSHAWKRLLPAYAATAAVVWILARGWEEPVWMWGLFYAGDTFWEHPFAEGIRRTVNWAGFHAALVLGAAAFFWKARPLRWRLALWLLLSFAAVCAGARFFPRYYLALLPPLAMAAARGFFLIPRRWLTPLLILTLAIPAVRFGARHAAIWRNNPGAMRDLVLFEDCRQAAVKIRALARPGDTLFVWGYRPELNVLAGLPGTTPFLDSQPLTGVPADRHLMQSEPALPELAARNRARLTQTSPTFVADGLGPLNPQLAIDRYPDLAEWLAHYELVERTAAAAVYRLRPALRSGSAPRPRKLPEIEGP
ncbi:MAG: glycosyltransferase family 39 protein [Bryobacteraceae bacterium]|nr:glycosyltransferase family 39 protein [Bryobacteraceae bacterium]